MMMETKDEVLGAVVLMERLIPRLNPNTRETLRRNNLTQVQSTLNIILQQVRNDCREPLILTPIMEVITLIDNVMSDETFVETDAETKHLMVDRLDSALNQLYLFAGKYYMKNQFTWSLTKTDVLRHIVDCCMNNGFYFDYDKILRAEGVL